VVSSSADPPAGLPIKRVWIAPERVPAELARARQGIFLQMPLADFEAREKRAARSNSAVGRPRLVKARYWDVRLAGDALVGKGEWTVLNPAGSSGVLPLPDLRLALQGVKVEGNDAILGDLDGKGVGLWLEKAGQQSVAFEWSLRGNASATALHFELQLPACALSSLELTLPREYEATTGGGPGLLAGPDDAGKADLRLWRLHSAGGAPVSLELRRTSGPKVVPALVLAGVRSRQRLLPHHVRAEYTLDLVVLHNAIGELVFDLDAPLEPTDVTLAGLPLRGWDVEHPKQGGAVLRVRLREPVKGALPPLHVNCLAPLPPDQDWVSPALHLRGAMPRGEQLELRVDPEVTLERWQPGGMRLLKSETDAAGAQVLTLSDGGAGRAARPSAHIQADGALVVVRQASWWQVGPHEAALTAELTYEVVRGRLFLMTVALPPAGDGWQIDGVELTEPRDLMRTWVPTTDKGRRVLLVELERGLKPRQQARLSVRLRAPGRPPLPPGGEALPFPQVAPLETGPLEGALAVSVEPFGEVTSAKASVPSTAPEGSGPWGKAPVQLFYVYRDRPLTGTLRLVPQRPVIHAHCRGEVLLARGGPSLQAQLTLEPVVGSPEFVDLYVSAAAARWKGKPAGPPGLVRRVERLSVREALPALLTLGGPDGLAAASALASRPGGTYWRLQFARPLSKREQCTLELAAEPETAGSARGGEQEWEVPLLDVPGADRFEGETVLHLTGAELRGVAAEGVRETGKDTARPAHGGAGRDLWQTFRHGHPPAGAPPRLRVRTRPVQEAVSALEVCDACHLTTVVEPGGRLLHDFVFRVRGWRARTLPLRLPPGVKILAARAQGRWVDRLPAHAAEGEAALVELPVAAGLAVHHFEVLYATEGAVGRWTPWSRLEAPLPELPVLPLEVRRTWRLPPGMAPLGSSVRRLPEPGASANDQAWEDALRESWRTGQALLSAAEPLLPDDESTAAQERAVRDAEAACRSQLKAPRPERLGPVLEKLVREHLRGAAPLVVDATACRAAGLDPDTPLAPAADESPFWEGVGLVYVPCRGGALLTTREEWRRWQQAGVTDGAVAEAVRQAARHGHDSSGRYWRALDWVQDPAARQPEGPVGSLLPPAPAGWTEWDTRAGAGAPEDLVIIRRTGTIALGLALAAGLCLLAWRLRRVLVGRWRVRLLLIWLALATLALLWLPAPLWEAALGPALAALITALVAYFCWPGPARLGGRTPPPSGERPRGVPSLPGAVLFLLVSLSPGLLVSWSAGQAVGPDADTVLILPGPAGAANRQTVLVPPELLKRLDALARGAESAPRGTVLLSANYYEGKVSDGAADFKADFTAYCADDDVTVKIPLGGVSLKEGSLWEGTFINPTPLAAPEVGYAVRIKGRKGKVITLTLPFSTRLRTAGDAVALSFTIPRLAQSQLTLTLPDGARLAQAVTAQGQQSSGDGKTLQASLGFADRGSKGSAVSVRWRQPMGTAPPPVVRVSEHHLWDLRRPVKDARLSSPSLTSVLRYAISGGSVTELAIDLPEGMEVRSIELTPTKATEPGGPVRLAGQDLAERKGKRRLTLTLSEPVTGTLQVTLGLLPRLAIAPGDLVLALPVPVRNAADRDGAPAGLLAYRLDGLHAVEKAHHLRLIPVPFSQFAQEWRKLLQPAGLDGVAQLERAYSFRRTQPGAALGLALSVPAATATTSLSWRVYPGHADLAASARLVAPAGDLLLVEWDVPPEVTVALVSGADVERWSRWGNLLQVWLREPRAETALQVRGWVRTEAAGRLALPHVRLLTPRPGRTEVHLAAVPGLTLEAAELDNLRPVTGAPPLTYEVSEPGRPYRAAFVLRPAAVQAEARSLTAVEARAGAVHFTTFVQLAVPPGELRTVTVRLRRWPGAEALLEAPGAVQQAEKGTGGEERGWVLRLPAGVTPYYTFKVTGRRPLPATGALPLPEVLTPGARVRERWLAVVGAELRPVGAHGVAPLKDLGELSRWPAEAELIRREGTAWKVRADDWKLAVAAQAAPLTPAVVVHFAEQAAAVADCRHWLHEAVYLVSGAGADLQLQLPEGARAVALALDGSPVRARQTGPQSLWLPLPGRFGVHTVRVRWRFADEPETADRPRLESPRLPGVPAFPIAWTVYLPPGFRLTRPEGASEHGAVRRDLDRAAAELELSAYLAGRQPKRAGSDTDEDLQQAQRRFAWYCRRAEGELIASPQGSDGRLQQQLQQLRQRDRELVRQHKLSPVAESSAGDGSGSPFTPLGGRGTPTYWRTGAGERPPVVTLQALSRRQNREALLATELFLVLLLGIWIVSHLPRLAVWLRRLWPELLLLLAVLGWQVFGPSLLGVALVLVAAAGRLWLLTGWLRGLLRQPPPVVGGSSFTPAAS
jgi:hypothetical protein